MLIVITNAKIKLAVLRITLLLGLLLLVGLSFNTMITDVAKNEDLDHAPGQPVRVQSPTNDSVSTDVAPPKNAQSQGQADNDQQTYGDTQQKDWFENLVGQLKEYYQGGR